MSKIALIAPGPSITHYGLMLQKSIAHPEELLIINAYMEDALDYVRFHLPEEVDVIIARGNTAALLKSAHLSIPIVTIPIHDSELIHSIYTAKELYQQEDSKIAYIGLDDEIQSVRGFLDILHCNIRLYPISSTEDIRKRIKQAKKDHIHVVIGGIRTQQEALEAGLHCVLLESSLASVKEAYERALEVQKGFILQRRKFQERTILLNSITDGIVSINEKGRITVCNPAAEQVFHVTSASVIGKTYPALFAQTEKELIQQALISGRLITEHRFQIRDQAFSLSIHPVSVGSSNKGVILTIRPFRGSASLHPFPMDDSRMLPSAPSFFDLAGSHPAFRAAVSLGLQYAKLSLPVLIIGEAGTGKETLARCIHQAGSGSGGLFLSREASLLTAEDLFAAHGGSLYIRNGQELSPFMQELLTDFLLTSSVMVDGHTRQDVTIRLMIGSEADLSAILTPRFYYLINTLILPVPALRQRISDLPALAENMLKRLNKQYHKNCQAAPEFLGQLEDCAWPGNLRQLESYLRRLVVLSSGETILSSLKESGSPDDCGFYSHLRTDDSAVLFALNSPRLESEPGFVVKGRKISYSELQELAQYYQGKKGVIAQKLGISRSTLWRYYKDMENYGIKLT